MKLKELTKNLREKSGSELLQELNSSKDKLWQLKADLNQGKVKNVKSVHQLKKTIAMVNTLLKEKKIAEQN